jgi:hypothetical protein
MEFLGIEGVMRLSHYRTHEKKDNLCRSHPKLQIGNLIFNHFEAQYSLAATRP